MTRKFALFAAVGASLARPMGFDDGVTRLSDLVIPAIWSPYVQVLTEEKSRLIQSGAMGSSATLASLLSGGGLTFNEPFFKDLDNDDENISSDDPASLSSPKKIATGTEIQIRMSRNQSWSSMDLNEALTGEDPMDAIANLVASYWTRRMQSAFVATLTGIFADNDAAPTGTDTHTQYDLTHDISGVSFDDGTTNFSAEAYLDTKVLMGDSQSALRMIMVHSIVYNRMQKNNLIDFVPDAVNPNAAAVPTFLGATVIVDDGVTNNAGVFQSWLFGQGAFQWGNGTAKTPTEFLRIPAAGNGSGQEIMWNRVEWCIHPVGHAYIGASPPKGGPANSGGSAPLNAAASWSRVFPERKQIKIARLVTREF